MEVRCDKADDYQSSSGWGSVDPMGGWLHGDSVAVAAGADADRQGDLG